MEPFLTSSNFWMYAVKAYNNPFGLCLVDFRRDLRRVAKVRQLLDVYTASGQIDVRAILNHIIVLNNMFGPHHTSVMLRYKCGRQNVQAVNSFLVYLSLCDGDPATDSKIDGLLMGV